MKNNLTTRTLTINPQTFDREKRTVRAVATTDAPAQVFDWERFEMCDEILRMDGADLPKNGQVPLLDSHNRDRISDVIGSATDFDFETLEGGQEALTCLVRFADTVAGHQAADLIRDGHLTDFSVGYRVTDSTWVPQGERAIVDGREYIGPVRVSRAWRLKELSATAIGADELAKARSEADGRNKQKEEHTIMSEETKVEVPAGLTEEQARAMAEEAVKAERERVAGIRQAARLAKIGPDVADELCESGMSLDQARAEILERMAKANPPIDGTVSQPEEVTFDSLVKKHLASGLSQGQAMKAAAIENPELHRAWLRK